MPRNFIPSVFQGPVNLTSQNAINETTRSLVDIVRPIIDRIIDGVNSGTFNYEPFAFNVPNNVSGLPPITGRAGLYVIINKESRKVYLGSSIDVSLRKADYNRGFNRVGERNRVYNSMHPDLNQ